MARVLRGGGPARETPMVPALLRRRRLRAGLRVPWHASVCGRGSGRDEQSGDGGETWELASEGLTVPWQDTMVEHFVPNDGPDGAELFAVLANGELLVAPQATLAWRRVAADVEGINAVTGIERAL